MNGKPDQKIILYNVLIGAVAALLFIPFLGAVNLFDWDEINFAESAREMISSGDFLTVQINYIPFWEKPPLFIWMQVLSMKVFGINEFAARLPNALCGVVSLLILFNLGRKLKDTLFGLTWVMLYGGSLLPFFYFKSGIIDPWFNLFIFLGIYYIYQYFEKPTLKTLHAAGSSFFIGLAILTKGPVALLVFAITTGIFLLVKKFSVRIRISDALAFVVVISVVGGLWFILQLFNGNSTIISDFIDYQIRLFRTQDAGHGGFLFYHFVVLFIGVFPASIFALPALFPSKYRTSGNNEFYIWMILLFWVVLILFTIVRTKIVHYSSLCYFPLTFLGAWAIAHKDHEKPVWKSVINGLIGLIGFLAGTLLIALTYIDHYKAAIINRNWMKDPFAVACLGADGQWKGYEFSAGMLLIAGVTAFLVLRIKNYHFRTIAVLTGAVSVFMFLAMLLIVPRVEAYSQRAAIDFFKSVSSEDAYMDTHGYKSYAHLFYGKMRQHQNKQIHEKEWLLKGNIDKPAYFSVKITRKEKFMTDYPKAIYLYEKNGFAFFKRAPGTE